MTSLPSSRMFSSVFYNPSLSSKSGHTPYPTHQSNSEDFSGALGRLSLTFPNLVNLPNEIDPCLHVAHRVLDR